jgi:hypothetical protein
LKLPQNCYIDTQSLLLFNPGSQSWQGCLQLNAPRDKVLDFFKSQFGAFGQVQAEAASGNGRVWNVLVQPAQGEFVALTAMLAGSGQDPNWTRVYLEFVSGGGQEETVKSMAGKLPSGSSAGRSAGGGSADGGGSSSGSAGGKGSSS